MVELLIQYIEDNGGSLRFFHRQPYNPKTGALIEDVRPFCVAQFVEGCGIREATEGVATTFEDAAAEVFEKIKFNLENEISIPELVDTDAFGTRV